MYTDAMFALNRRHSIALLLIVMISYTAFSIHMSTHAPADEGSCELCGGYGSQPHAVSDAELERVAPTRFIFEPETTLATIVAVPLLHYRQRAPPS